MSQMTDHMENKLADFARGQALTLPASWYFGLLSAASDASVTELSGTGYGRIARARSLANFAGTQGAGTTLASTGTSHTTSNNAVVDWGTSGSAWGTATHVGVFDASSGGNCWMIFQLGAPMVIGSGAAVSIAAAGIVFTLGATGGLTDYAANKLIDLIFRAQAYTWPANLYAALFTAAPSNAGGGTEVSGGAYARAAIASSLAAWSGTQSAGSTVASSGTGGRISNNATLTYPAATASWGTVSHEGLYDAASAGNLMFWGALSAARTVNAGGPAQSHPADTIAITLA